MKSLSGWVGTGRPGEHTCVQQQPATAPTPPKAAPGNHGSATELHLTQEKLEIYISRGDGMFSFGATFKQILSEKSKTQPQNPG